MTLEQTAKIITLIASVWPKAWANTKGNEAEVIKVWHEMLQDLDAGQVYLSIKHQMATSDWPPTIHEIRKVCTKGARLPSPSEGWQETMTAIRRFGYAQEEEALASCNPVTATVVGRLGWRTMCMAPEGDAAMRAHFMKIYEQVQEREDRIALIPPDVRKALGYEQVLQLEEGGR
jgi:hypothetical protein